uniref:Uncharacterized protein n=1 Tax=Angiostrongylus cantonensis TaxID=6313 RepID=A0A0K0DPK2_ANGCA
MGTSAATVSMDEYANARLVHDIPLVGGGNGRITSTSRQTSVTFSLIGNSCCHTFVIVNPSLSTKRSDDPLYSRHRPIDGSCGIGVRLTSDWERYALTYLRIVATGLFPICNGF